MGRIILTSHIHTQCHTHTRTQTHTHMHTYKPTNKSYKLDYCSHNSKRLNQQTWPRVSTNHRKVLYDLKLPSFVHGRLWLLPTKPHETELLRKTAPWDRTHAHTVEIPNLISCDRETQSTTFERIRSCHLSWMVFHNSTARVSGT